MKKNLEEDFLVHATLIIAGQEFVDIPCKIYLPEYITEKPWMEFRPKVEQRYEILRAHKGELKAEVINFNNKKEVSIFAPIVYFNEINTKHWGPDISESTFTGDPQHLQITRYISPDDMPPKTLITFWISPNSMLTPATSDTLSNNGKIETPKVYEFKFNIQNKCELTFDKHFRYKSFGNGELKRWSYLVATTEINIPANDVNKIKSELLPCIDDFLLIASLGSRTRTACLGWEATDGESFTTYYRGNFTFPTGESEHSFDQGLVWLKDFQLFLETGYKSFLSYANKQAIRRATRSVVPGRKKVSEESFLSMFAGIETLILDYRRRKNIEFVLTDGKWSKIKDKLKSAIKNFDNPCLNKKERSFLYSKLNDLNRVPLRIAFDQFCNNYNIDLSDLWPAFASENKIGLSDIRNRIIHGDTYPFKFNYPLWVAEENLHFLLERILVSILDWPIQKTEVDNNFLKTHSTAIKNLPDILSKILNNSYIANNNI